MNEYEEYSQEEIRFNALERDRKTREIGQLFRIQNNNEFTVDDIHQIAVQHDALRRRLIGKIKKLDACWAGKYSDEFLDDADLNELHACLEECQDELLKDMKCQVGKAKTQVKIKRKKLDVLTELLEMKPAKAFSQVMEKARNLMHFHKASLNMELDE